MIDNCRDGYFGQRVGSGILPKQMKLVARESVFTVEQLDYISDQLAAGRELVQDA
ncbi:hypothetical protein [Bradyrhizobium retamae]|uniref:hypothetical protein n=1 Tax=Bradyrhizobium retamae TaxID=1300035 RepID=UPI000AD0EFF9|nr:hypothetical protein [Bradyrhizobium retamae]